MCLMFETSQLASQILPMNSITYWGMDGLELWGVVQIISPFSRKVKDSKPPNNATKDLLEYP